MMGLKIALLVVLAVAVASAQLLGGYKDITDLNAPDVQDAARVAQEHLAASNSPGVCATSLSLVSGQVQLVNGKNYKFTYSSNPTQCGENGPAKTCTVTVHVSFDQTVKTPQTPSCQ